MVSARVHYATQALIELAIRRDDPDPVTLREITDRHGVPGPFLTQIMRTLRAVGWVRSIRGAGGGYRLSIDPAGVTVADIVAAVGCETSTEATGDHASDRILADLWTAGDAARRDVWQRTTLDDLADGVRTAAESAAAMYYI